MSDIAFLPFSLSENIPPSDLGHLLTMAHDQKRKPEDLIAFAVREFVAAHRAHSQKPLTGGAAEQVAAAA